MMAKHRATFTFGAHDKAGVKPLASKASTEAPLAISCFVTSNKPFLADK